MGPHPGRKLITLKAGAPAAPKKPPVRPLGPSDVAKARRVAQAEALAWLAETYPAAFGSVVRPLALGAGRLVSGPRQNAGGSSAARSTPR
jgi:hypothetical protein